MKVSIRAFAVIPCIALLLAAAPSAHANTYSGVAFCDIQANTGGNGSGFAINTPTLAQLGTAQSTSAGQCATFTGAGNSINFATGIDSTAAVSPGVTGGLSLANFLNYGGGLTSSTFFALPGANGAGPTLADGSQNNNGTLLLLAGLDFLTNGESITFSHDDGALLYVCPVVAICTLGSGDIPTAPANYSLISPAGSGAQTTNGQAPFSFAGATGAYNFLLVYNSNYAQPSALLTNINTGTPPPSGVPEPSGLILLGTGVITAAGMVRRRSSPNVIA